MLPIPDGVATEPGGAWLAISNHAANTVHMYRYSISLGTASEPARHRRRRRVSALAENIRSKYS